MARSEEDVMICSVLYIWYMFHTRYKEARLNPLFGAQANTVTEWQSWLKAVSLKQYCAHKLKYKVNLTMPSTRNQKKNRESPTMSDDDENPPERQDPEDLLTDTATANAANAPEERDQGLTGNGLEEEKVEEEKDEEEKVEEEKDGEEKDEEGKDDSDDDSESSDDSDEDDTDLANLSDIALAGKLLAKDDDGNNEQSKHQLQQQMEKVFGKVPVNYDPGNNIPGLEYCQSVNYNFTRERRPKKQGNKKGIGLELSSRGVGGPTEIVSVMASTGDKMYTNEPNATYYYKLMFRIAELRRKKNISNAAATKRVFKEQVTWLARAGGYIDPDERGNLFSTRQARFFFTNVMGAYNKDNNLAIGNRTLHNIAITYAKMRTGNLQSNSKNEVIAAIDAVRAEFLRVYKNDQANVGKEQWCFPIILLLNDHLNNFAKLPPIRHHPWYQYNEELANKLEEDTEVIWVKEAPSSTSKTSPKKTPKGSKKKKRKTPEPDLIKIGIERRPQIREQLLSFLNRNKRADQPDYTMAEGFDPPTNPHTPSKKRQTKVDLTTQRLY